MNAESDACLRRCGQEMNLSETAYIQPVSDSPGDTPFLTCDRFTLRWFTPMDEVALCGHATVASAAALFQGDRVQLLSVARLHCLYDRNGVHVDREHRWAVPIDSLLVMHHQNR